MKNTTLFILLSLFIISCDEKISERTLGRFESTKLSEKELMETCNVKYKKDEFSEVSSKSIHKTNFGEMNNDLMKLIQKTDIYKSNYKIWLYIHSFNTGKLLLSFSEIGVEDQYIFEDKSYCLIKFIDGDILELKHSGKSDFGSSFSFDINKKSVYYKLRTKEIDRIRLVGESNVHDYSIHTWNKDYLIKNLQCVDNPFND